MSATPAEVGVEGAEDVVAGRRHGALAEDREGGDDPWQAVAALTGVDSDHGVDDPCRSPLAHETLERRDRTTGRIADRHGARGRWGAVEQHPARAALVHAAAVLRAGQPQLVAQRP